MFPSPRIMPAAPLHSKASFAPVRHFLGWDRPLLAGVVEYLAGAWSGGVLDLSDRLIVVPTRQSGRRLREALAERAAERGAAVFPPQVLTPEAFLTVLRPEGPPVATAAEALLTWAAVLGAVRLEDFPSLFPQAPPRAGVEWALRVAEAWQAVRQTLGEGGVSMAAAAARLAAAEHPEAARWADLARLETLYFDRLAAAGREDAQVARGQAAAAPVLPSGVARIDFAAVPDPLEIAVLAACRLGEAGVPVAVLVTAPSGREASFDEWGRPEPGVWTEARDLPLPPDWCHLVAGPSEQAETVRALVAGHADPAATLGLGVADPEVAAALVVPGGPGAERPDPGRLVCYRPEGLPLGGHELWHVLAGAAALLREETFRALGQWLRFPPVAGLLRQRAGLPEAVSQAALLKAWDAYAAAHLPQSLADGRAFVDAVVNPLAAAAAAVLAEFSTQPLERAVAGLLAALYGRRKFPQATSEGSAFRAFARELSECLRQTGAAAAMAGLKATPAERLAFVLDQLRRVRLETGERPEAAVDVNGWLELAWEDAPHLVLAGLNDGLVPDVIVGDPYLPESLRGRLGLRRSNATRFARDAHLLHALVCSRLAAGGRVDVVLGQHSAAGEVLRPSRLLFLRPDDELSARAAALFGEDCLPAAAPLPARRLAWRLRAPAPRPLEKLSVTAFREYLSCPFRFYLRHVLRMETVDPEPRELDAMGFGSLCHAALKALAAEPGLRRCTEEPVIADFLRAEVRRVLRESHGPRLTVPLRVQLASAEKRLAALAGWQAQSVREGWETVATELPFADLLGAPWMLGGLEIRGRIDRVDRRGADCRIIDYKTSDAPRPVAESHLGKKLSASGLAAERPAWQLHVNAAGHSFAWRDLQLPLYALAARQANSALPEVGYFHLAKAAEDCRYEAWTGLDAAVLDAAEACALGVAEAIHGQVFWPPREAGRFDDFARMLSGDAAAAVDPSLLPHP